MTAVRSRKGTGLSLSLLSLFAMVPWAVRAAQDPPQPGDGPAQVNLATRYRFVERYADPTGKLKSPAGTIHAFKAAFAETIRVMTDAPEGGAPLRDEWSNQAIWVERPTKLAADGLRAIYSLRRYEKVRVAPDPRTGPNEAPMLEGAVLLLRSQEGGPMVLRFDEGSAMLVEEYRFLRNHLNPGDLVALLPTTLVHIGDTWRVGRLPAGLIAGRPSGAGTLTGRLEEIRPAKEAGDPDIAVFSYEGEVPTGIGQASIAARAEFAFWAKEKKEGAAPRNAANQEFVDGYGAIVKLSLGQQDNRIPLPKEPRRKRDFHRELVFECRLLPGGDEAMPLPREMPKPSPDNTWLTFVDPGGRYRVRFPQEMEPDDVGPKGITLRNRRTEPIESIRFDVVEGAQPKIDDFSKEMKGVWLDDRVRVISGGPPQLLDEAVRPDLRIHRIEASLRPQIQATNASPAAQARRHFFGYTVQTGGRSGLTVEALTTADPPTTFRDQVEQVIREFRFAGVGEP